MKLKVPLLLILATGVSLSARFCSVRWQTASQTLANTVRDSVIGCAENLLLGSLRTYQSSLTYVFKATLLAACSSCHGNPNAISPIVWTARYPESLFSESCFIKGGEIDSGSLFLLQYFRLCMYSTCWVWGFICVFVHQCTNPWMRASSCVHSCKDGWMVDVLHLTFTSNRLDCSGAAQLSSINTVENAQ